MWEEIKIELHVLMEDIFWGPGGHGAQEGMERRRAWGRGGPGGKSKITSARRRRASKLSFFRPTFRTFQTLRTRKLVPELEID